MLASLFANKRLINGRLAGSFFQNTSRYSYSLSLVGMYAMYQQYANVSFNNVINCVESKS